MMDITKEVAKLQEELMKLKTESISMNESSVLISDSISEQEFIEEEKPTSPVLKKTSSYHINGKLNQHKAQRRISWCSGVVDNAKGPGEDSLSDIIKKRSFKRRNRSSNPNSALTTIMYCIAVYLLSLWVPRFIEYVLNRRSSDEL
mmetsp:Transcript_22795/g.29754  ORF Transcript_22795/g.29754 Transcript_22795/m.29754 type:complete len:146 (+) Transcript_22795:244-681(+)